MHFSAPKGIFKTYDIRGLAKEELSEALAKRVGAAVVRLTGAKVLVVGRDMRETSPAYAEAVMEGAREQGANVVDIGLCSTPLFNFAVTHYSEHDAGVMVTASHNPVAYNGFKMMKHSSETIGKGTGMEELFTLVTEDPLEHGSVLGERHPLNVEEEYLQEIFSAAAPLPAMDELRVVVDAGNGMGGMLIPRILDKLGCAWEGLYLEPDGRFPHHEANPLKDETLHDLRTRMNTFGAHLGIALDGDGDRIAFLDETGKLIRGDYVMGILAGDVLAKHKGGVVYHDLRATQAVRDAIRAAGGDPRMSEVGHANFKRHLREDDGVFGGELSCHFFFKEFGYCEASEYMLLLFLSHLVHSAKKASELVGPLATFANSGEVNFEVADRDAVIAAVEAKYAGSAKRRLDLDGVTLYFETWWFNLRLSNTEPVVRLTVEADTDEELKGHLQELSDLLASVNH